MFLCLQKNNDDKGHTHQNTRKNTCCEHIGNGYACDGCINNECNTRRYDDRNRTCRRHQGCGKRSRKSASLNHGRDQNHTKCCYGCRTGTGNRAKEAGYDNAYDRDTALFMADAGVDETNQSFGNARFCHNVSGQYKERNGKEQKFTDTGIHIGCYDGQGCTGVQDRADRRQTKADANRDTKDQKNKE